MHTLLYLLVDSLISYYIFSTCGFDHLSVLHKNKLKNNQKYQKNCKTVYKNHTYICIYKPENDTLKATY